MMPGPPIQLVQLRVGRQVHRQGVKTNVTGPQFQQRLPGVRHGMGALVSRVVGEAITENEEEAHPGGCAEQFPGGMPDGSPQVTPVWFDFDGNHVRVNSAKGRVKDTNRTC